MDLVPLNFKMKSYSFVENLHQKQWPKNVLEKRGFAKLSGKQLWRIVFLNKVAGCRAVTKLKRDFGIDVFL